MSMITNRMISEIITEDSPTSIEVSGADIAAMGSSAQNTLITAQVIPQVDDPNFEVHLEAAAADAYGAYVFTKIGEFTEDTDDLLLSVFPISLSCRYRYKHISGDSCKVILRD